MTRTFDLADLVTHPPVLDPPLKECPHCGSDQFYIRFRVSGKIDEHHRFDIVVTDNGDMWDNVNLKPLKRAHCSDCLKPISKIIRTYNRDVRQHARPHSSHYCAYRMP